LQKTQKEFLLTPNLSLAPSQMSRQLKSNPGQLLVLDYDDTIYGNSGNGPRECRPGLGEFLKRQNARRNVAVYSGSAKAKIQERLGENAQHLDWIFSQQEPIMSAPDILLLQGGLHHRSEVAEITNATKAQIQAAREAVEGRDNPKLVETLRIMLFALEIHGIDAEMRRHGRVISSNEIGVQMSEYPGIASGKDFHFPFHSGATLTSELEKRIRKYLECREDEGSIKYERKLNHIIDQLEAHRIQGGFKDVLDKYLNQIKTKWTYKGSGKPVSKNDYYRNPYADSIDGFKKDLHRLRLRVVQEGKIATPKMIMIEDWNGFQGGIHASDPLTPLVVVHPEDSGWIQRGAIERFVEQLFQHPQGPDHAFHAMLSAASTPAANTSLFSCTGSITLDSHRFLLGAGSQGGLVGLEDTPTNRELIADAWEAPDETDYSGVGG
jgi:hypothetical protein